MRSFCEQVKHSVTKGQGAAAGVAESFRGARFRKTMSITAISYYYCCTIACVSFVTHQWVPSDLSKVILTLRRYAEFPYAHDMSSARSYSKDNRSSSQPVSFSVAAPRCAYHIRVGARRPESALTAVRAMITRVGVESALNGTRSPKQQNYLHE